MFNKYNAFFLVIIAFLSISCTCNSLPRVKNPTYKMYNFNGEKGYNVSFELANNSATPTAVVINRIKQPISEDTKVNDSYKLNVIAETRKLFGYKPEMVDNENGIFFKIDTANVFKPVKFKLLEK